MMRTDIHTGKCKNFFLTMMLAIKKIAYLQV